MVPVLDWNGCAVTTSIVKVKKEKILFNKAKYNIGMETWLNQNITKLDDDGKANMSYRENKNKCLNELSTSQIAERSILI